MPRKIVEREIIDEDSELSGSEHSITNTEPTPPPTNQNILKPKKDKQLIEINKKLRTANATAARIKNKKEKEIQLGIEQRLNEQRQKEEEQKKLKMSFENEVSSIVNKILSKSTPQTETVKPVKEPKPVKTSKTQKPKKQQIEDHQEYEQEHPKDDLQAYKLYRNLFM
jgi:hypothetical protein